MSTREPRRRRLLTGAILALGAALPLLRVLVDPLHRLPGDAAGDVYKHTWSFWHTLAVLEQGTWPWTPYLAAPDGGVLLDVNLLPALLLAPVTLLGGPVLAANLFLWLSLWAVGGATAALARRLTGSWIGAAVAGLSVQSSPYLVGHALVSGVHERIAIWSFPLALWCLLLLGRSPPGAQRRGAVAVLGATGAWLALSCSTYAVFFAVLVSVSMAAVVLLPGPGSRRDRLLRLLPAVGVLAGVFGAAFLLVRWFSLHPSSLVTPSTPERVAAAVGPGGGVRETTSLATLLHPATVAAQQPTETGDALHHLVYLGWIPLLGALAGAVLAWRRHRRGVAGVLALGVLFLLLSFGAGFQLHGAVPGTADDPGGLPGGLPNPLYRLASFLVPTYGAIPTPWQQVAVYEALAPVGLAALVATPGRALARVLVGGALLLGVVGERAAVLPVSLPVAPAPGSVPEVYHHVGSDGILLDIPRFWRGRRLVRGTLFLAQSLHERPLAITLDVGLTGWDWYEPVRTGRYGDYGAFLRCLHARGVRWLVVHPAWFAAPGDGDRILRALEEAAGPPHHRGSEAVLYDLDELDALDEPDRHPGAVPDDCPPGRFPHLLDIPGGQRPGPRDPHAPSGDPKPWSGPRWRVPDPGAGGPSPPEIP